MRDNLARDNLGRFIKGHPDLVSPESRKRQSLNQSGIKHWNWAGGRPKCIDCGKTVLKYSSKRCKKCSNSYFSTLLKGKKSFMLGRHHTEKTKKKMSLNHRGDKSNLWKGGITELNGNLRKSWKYLEWRRKVFKKFNYMCNQCKKRNTRKIKISLHAHHIKDWENYPNLRFKVSNGELLCYECHRKKHKHHF